MVLCHAVVPYVCVCVCLCVCTILTVTYSESISLQSLATCVSWVAFNLTKDGQQVSRYTVYVYSAGNEGREKERMHVLGSTCGENISPVDMPLRAIVFRWQVRSSYKWRPLHLQRRTK